MTRFLACLFLLAAVDMQTGQRSAAIHNSYRLGAWKMADARECRHSRIEMETAAR